MRCTTSASLLYEHRQRVADLETRIERALQAALGFDVDVFVRTSAEVAEVVRFAPFAADEIAASDGNVQVTFLRDEPEPSAVGEAMVHASEQDRLVVAGRAWYWLPRTGISTSAFDVKAIERALGRGTTRTMITLTRLYPKLLVD